MNKRKGEVFRLMKKKEGGWCHRAMQAARILASVTVTPVSSTCFACAIARYGLSSPATAKDSRALWRRLESMGFGQLNKGLPSGLDNELYSSPCEWSTWLALPHLGAASCAVYVATYASPPALPLAPQLQPTPGLGTSDPCSYGSRKSPSITSG